MVNCVSIGSTYREWGRSPHTNWGHAVVCSHTLKQLFFGVFLLKPVSLSQIGMLEFVVIGHSQSPLATYKK